MLPDKCARLHQKLRHGMVRLHGAPACCKVCSSFLETVQCGEVKAAELTEHFQTLACEDRRPHHSPQGHWSTMQKLSTVYARYVGESTLHWLLHVHFAKSGCRSAPPDIETPCITICMCCLGPQPATLFPTFSNSLTSHQFDGVVCLCYQ